MMTMNGMIVGTDGVERPGAILKAWLELRRHTGALEAKDKQGVRFKVRSSEDLVDMIRELSNELGILIYPGEGTVGEGKVVDSGTLADVNMVVIAQSVEDGSMLAFCGYGQGADNQDKAGGKAMTYASKATLVQALLAGGKKTAKALGIRDTDDSSDPLAGGVRPRKVDSLAGMRKELEAVEDVDYYKALRPQLVALSNEDRQALAKEIKAAQNRAGYVAPTVAK